MDGIKGIAGILDSLVMGTLFAVIEPDRDEGQDSKALLGNLNNPAEH